MVKCAKPVQILIVSADCLVVAALKNLFSKHPEVEVAAICGNKGEAVEFATKLIPDIVVLDSPIPGIDTFEFVKEINNLTQTPKVILLTMQDDVDHFVEACKSGVNSYILRHGTADQILPAIMAVSAGSVVIDASLFKSVVQHVPDSHLRNRRTTSRDQLTQREMEVLRLAAKGYTNKQIASELRISSRAVKAHVSNVIAKTVTHNRTEAVSAAIEHRLI